MDDGFPLLTTKTLHLRSIIHELLWFLKGDTNVKYLQENKVSIWDEWADEEGILAGFMVHRTDWKKPDGGNLNQIEEVIQSIKENSSRRHLVCAWNPGEFNYGFAPMPCTFSIYVRRKTKLPTISVGRPLWESHLTSLPTLF